MAPVAPRRRESEAGRVGVWVWRARSFEGGGRRKRDAHTAPDGPTTRCGGLAGRCALPRGGRGCETERGRRSGRESTGGASAGGAEGSGLDRSTACCGACE